MSKILPSSDNNDILQKVSLCLCLCLRVCVCGGRFGYCPVKMIVSRSITGSQRMSHLPYTTVGVIGEKQLGKKTGSQKTAPGPPKFGLAKIQISQFLQIFFHFFILRYHFATIHSLKTLFKTPFLLLWMFRGGKKMS